MKVLANSKVVGEGRGADVLGDPLAAATWLANFQREREGLAMGEVISTGTCSGFYRDPCQHHTDNVRNNGPRETRHAVPALLAEQDPNVNAVAAHVGGEDLEESDVANRIDESADRGKAQRNGDSAAGAELTSVAHMRFKASFAAL